MCNIASALLNVGMVHIMCMVCFFALYGSLGLRGCRIPISLLIQEWEDRQEAILHNQLA